MSDGEVDEKRVETDDDEDELGSGWRGALLSLSGFAVTIRLGLGEDTGSGPATADKRSNGSSDVSGADGDRGEEWSGE